MQIHRHPDVDKDLKRLKSFSAPQESLEAWERFFHSKGLKETSGLDKYPGFGSSAIYKARVLPLRENCGKSKGYRLIFKVLDKYSILILVFSRHGVYSREKELIDLIKSRL